MSATATASTLSRWPRLLRATIPHAGKPHQRRWWEVVIMCTAVGVFVWLALGTRAQHISISLPWTIVLVIGTLVPLGVCGTLLWRRTRFS